MINTKKIFQIVVLLFSVFLSSQQKIDGIAAVVGDEIVLESDIKELMKHAQSQGYKITNKCEFIENTLLNKILLYQAKQDTLIKVTKDDIKSNVDRMVEGYLAQAGSEKALLEGFGSSTMSDLRNELEIEIEGQMYSEEKRKLITKNIDVTPYELSDFFNKYKDKLPSVKDEVSLSHIVIFPELSEKSKEKLIDKLNSMKKDIEEGISTFENKARIYSQDPGSSSNGGFYGNVKRGKMVKEFDAVAFNLEEGQISEPFATEYGYHIIKLEKRKGQVLDLRHILLESIPNSDEISKAKKKLDSIKTLILEDKITFKEAALKFSNDKATRYNGGNIVDSNTGDNHIEKSKLNSKELIYISGLKPNDMSDVFEDDFQRKKAVRLIRVNDILPEHKLDLSTDYSKIKNIALNKKKQDKIQKWVVEQIPKTLITVQKEYQDCDFDINWLNKPNFVKKEESNLEE